MSDLIVNSKDGINQIKELQFGVLSTSDIAKLSTIECVNRNLYDENKIPIPYGPIDNRLGVNQKYLQCPTCKKKIENCPGHFGYIRLKLPIFHIGFFKEIVNILRCICKNCSRILLPEEEKYKYRIKLSNKTSKLSSQQMKNILKEINTLCQKVKICNYCGYLNGKVKHVQGITGPTIILHEITKNDLEDIEEKNNNEKSFKQKYDTAIILFSQKEKNKIGNFNTDIEKNINTLKNIFNNSNNNKITTELTSPFVYQLFSKISPEDIIFFGMDNINSSPINLLLQYILVPPLPIRPTVQVGTNGTNEDDLTIKIREMIHVNNYLKMYIEEGNGNTYKLMEDLNLLQSTHAYYINSDTKGINKNIVGNKQIRSLCTRLKGKTGRFRGNLCGKRVDFSGRTVISPDPNLRIDQIGVPVNMAKLLTYPEKVTFYNIKKLKKMILNGPENHPGANFVISKNKYGENRISLGFIDKKRVIEVCNELKIGDIVERHLVNNDIVLFNRQPSLHTLSIMGFHAKILPWRTMRFNESNCTPFNADFDGDEMNIHLPQTEEAKSECLNLMGVIENLRSPKLGEPLIASTQDFLLTCFLITKKDYFLDRTHFMRYCAYFNDANEKIDIPPPTIFKPKELWTGKQLFSVILKPNKNYDIIINLKIKTKNSDEEFVIIKNSILLSGRIEKSIIGNGGKNSLIFALIKDCGNIATAKFLTRISKFSARWICDYGFSLGISDVTPSKNLLENKKQIINKGFEECDKQIDLYNNNSIELKAGLNAEESLENISMGILSDIRKKVGESLRKNLPKTNSGLLMTICGSKGKEINLAQMISCVGQQELWDKRPADGFNNRTLPHFEEFSKYPSSKGFVAHSFFDGMDATEFFFHAMGGRVGLVDSAVKTAETGYMQRRLMKCMEDLTVQYNNTVSMSNGDIIEFLYGGDGIATVNTDTDGCIVFLPRLWELVKCKNDIKNDEILSVKDIMENVENYINCCDIKKYDVNENFVNSIRKFFVDKINLIENAIKSFGDDDNNYNNIVNNICCVGKKQLKIFFDILWEKYKKAKVNPGEAVGAIAGMSIGEPCTQMTLKTFHFAGVSGMDITLGVPRIKEIINYTKNISTPVIYATLLQEDDLTAAKIVKGRIEKIKLSKVCKYIKEIISPNGCFIKVKLNKKYIQERHLSINIEKIKNALLLNKKKLKLKENHIIIENDTKLIIYPPETNKNYLYFTLESLMKNLPDIIISGVNTINRIVISKKKNDESKYMLAVEGTGLLDIMKIDGIDYKHCKSNNISEILETLGIEAARSAIIYELDYTFGENGVHIDKRHLDLTADLMTLKGTVYGFQRFGMIKMKDSVLLHSSFERTNDILFEAALHGKVDKLNGVTESIIAGKTAPVGTGIFKLFMDRKEFDDGIDDFKKGRGVNEVESGKYDFDDGKDFAKGEIKFNMVDMIK